MGRTQQLRTLGGSLSAKLLALVVVLALVPLIVLGVVLMRQSRSALEDAALQDVESRAQDMAQVVESRLAGTASGLALLARTSTLQDAPAAEQQALVDSLRAQWQVDDVAVFDLDGNLLAGTLGGYANVAQTRSFQEALALQPGQVAAPLEWDEAVGADAFHLVTPVVAPDGTVTGVAWATYDATGAGGLLGGLLGLTDAASTSTADLADANGVIVASTDPARIGQSVSGLAAFQAATAEAAAGAAQEALGDEQVFTGFAPMAALALTETASSTLPAGGAVFLMYEPESVALAGLDGQRNVTWLTIAVVSLLALVLVYLFYRMLMRPLRELTSVAERVGSGERTARAEVRSSGEIGMLAAALNRALDELAASGQTPQERDRLQAQLATLLAEVSEAARGDLTVEAYVPSGALGSLADAFNYMVAELRRIIADVNATTNEVSSATSEIAQRSGSVARYSADQARQIAGATMAVSEMSMSIQQVSDNARVSSAVAREAETNARSGYEAVRVTIDGMERIRQQVQEASRIVTRLGESSTEISSIVQLIAQIARQTNTLALNASIQAARAGEHGRGFAVVADEVRKLAERSSSATKQISGLVTSIQAETSEAIAAMETSMREVNDGSLVADQAGVALEQIDAVVNRMTELIDSISQMSEQQAHVALDISNAMREISDITETTTVDTRDTADSADRLSGLAERLRRSVATFKLEGAASSGMSWQGANADGDD